MNTFRVYLAILITTGAAFAAPKNIDEYFKSLPQQNFAEFTSPKLLEKIQRDRGQNIFDPKNGYMYLEADGAQVSLQIAQFRYKPGIEPLLAISHGGLDQPFTHLSFFIEKEGKMIPAARSLFPIANSKNLRFNLPRTA